MAASGENPIRTTTASSVSRMLQLNRALPDVPAPHFHFMDSHILFNNNTAMFPVPTPPTSDLRQELRVPQPSRFLKAALTASKPQQLRRTPSTMSATSSTDAASVKTVAQNLGTVAPSWALPINHRALKVHLLKEGTLDPNDAIRIVDHVKELLRAEPNVLRLQEPIVVVGDIHGQFYDLVKLLEIGGEVGSMTYLFLGDYVDRGCFSCECVLLLYALKICFPTSVYLLRGNHEARHLTSYFNFKQECNIKYCSEFYDAVIQSFDCLPLAAMVGQRYFCVHGGLSAEVQHIDEIMFIQRFREIPSAGAMCDLLWSDPHGDVENPLSSKDGSFSYAATPYSEMVPKFTDNEARGCGYIFNFGCLHQFIKTNQILCVIRAHEMQDEGYKLYRPHPNTHFPSMLTVFSAPNYCDTNNNKGAVVLLKDGMMCIKQFYSSPHPFVLPNFMNGIEWSFPFVVDKLLAALIYLLAPPSVSPAAWETPTDVDLSSLLKLTPAEELEVQDELRRADSSEAPRRAPKAPEAPPLEADVISTKALVELLGRTAIEMSFQHSSTQS